MTGLVTFVPDQGPNVPNLRTLALCMLKLSGEVRVAEGPADS